MIRTLLVILSTLALAIYAPDAQAVQLVHFKGKLSALLPFGPTDELSQYFGVNDTFEGSFELDETSPADSSLPPPWQNVGTISRYYAVNGYFSLRFTSGASAGYTMHGLTPANNFVVAANNILTSPSSSTLMDQAGGNFRLRFQEFRPRLRQDSLSFSFTDFNDLSMLTSSSLLSWNPDRILSRHDTQLNEISFMSPTGDLQSARFNFTDFTLANSAAPAVDTTPLPTGATSTSVLGGSSGTEAGALSINFGTGVATSGVLQASYSTPSTTAFTESYVNTPGFAVGNFSTGPGLQVWELDYTGQFAAGQPVTLSFNYDATNLSGPEGQLGIWHFGKYGLNGTREWKFLDGNVDTVNNVITVTVDHFSPFALGVNVTAVPEPSTCLLLVAGTLLIGGSRRQR